MSENVIYCYSGSGNCLDMAKKIAAELGDTDIVLMRSYPAITDATGYKCLGFVFPCYGGGLPGDVEKFIKDIRFDESAYRFAVVQYAGYKGCGLYKLNAKVGLHYWSGISNHCSAIWLMPHDLTFPRTTLPEAQQRSDKAALEVAAAVRARQKSAGKPPKNALCALESAGFSKINRFINSRMTVNDDCTACGRCAAICPRGNIRISAGKAVIGRDCFGCMACVEYCPQEAINVGRITVKRERFHNANVTAEELTEKVIHLD